MARSKVFVPGANDFACVSFRSDNIIRAYKQAPRLNSYVDYEDFYIHSNYYSVTGTQQFSQYSTLPTCVDSSLVTDDFYYRIDFDRILIIFLIVCIFAFYLPFKVFSRFCKKLWR